MISSSTTPQMPSFTETGKEINRYLSSDSFKEKPTEKIQKVISQSFTYAQLAQDQLNLKDSLIQNLENSNKLLEDGNKIIREMHCFLQINYNRLKEITEQTRKENENLLVKYKSSIEKIEDIQKVIQGIKVDYTTLCTKENLLEENYSNLAAKTRQIVLKTGEIQKEVESLTSSYEELNKQNQALKISSDDILKKYKLLDENHASLKKESVKLKERCITLEKVNSTQKNQISEAIRQNEIMQKRSEEQAKEMAILKEKYAPYDRTIKVIEKEIYPRLPASVKMMGIIVGFIYQKLTA